MLCVTPNQVSLLVVCQEPVQWNLSWETTAMSDHCYDRPPVLKDPIFLAEGAHFNNMLPKTTLRYHIFMANGAVCHDRFYRIFSSWSTLNKVVKFVFWDIFHCLFDSVCRMFSPILMIPVIISQRVTFIVLFFFFSDKSAAVLSTHGHLKIVQVDWRSSENTSTLMLNAGNKHRVQNNNKKKLIIRAIVLGLQWISHVKGHEKEACYKRGSRWIHSAIREARNC